MKNLKLIIISGLPCSGKSTLAESIAKKLKLPIFSVDPIESSILKSGVKNKRSFETGLAAYLVVQALASEQLKIGLSVIIDAVSPVKEARKMWSELSEKYNAQQIIIECVLDKDLHIKRIQNRVRNMYGIPEVTIDSVEKCKKEFLKWKDKRLIIDTANNLEKNLIKALKYIGSIN